MQSEFSPPEIRHSRLTMVFCLVLLILGLGARSYSLGVGELMPDEGFTALLTSRPLKIQMQETARDVHPPLHPVLVTLSRWITQDSSEWTLRLPSWIGSSLGLIAAFLFFRRELSSLPLLLALATVALNPLQLLCAQEARAYGLLSGLGFCLAVAYQDWRRSPTRSRIILLILLEAFLVHIHYFSWLLIGLLSLDSLRTFPEQRRHWAGAHLALLALCMPWWIYALPLKLASPYAGNEWRSPVSWLETLPIVGTTASVWLLGGVRYSGASPGWWAPWIFLATGLFQTRTESSGIPASSKTAWTLLLPSLLICALLQPFLGEFHWLARYLIGLSPWILLLMARTIEGWIERLSRSIQIALVAGLVLVLMSAGAGYSTAPRASYLRRVAPLVASSKPEESLILSLDTGWTLAHYLGPRGIEHQRWALLDPAHPEYGSKWWSPTDLVSRDNIGTPLFAPHEPLLRYLGSPEAPDEIWLVVTNFVLQERPPARIFLSQLAKLYPLHDQPLPSEEVGDLSLWRFRRPPPRGNSS